MALARPYESLEKRDDVSPELKAAVTTLIKETAEASRVAKEGALQERLPGPPVEPAEPAEPAAVSDDSSCEFVTTNKAGESSCEFEFGAPAGGGSDSSGCDLSHFSVGASAPSAAPRKWKQVAWKGELLPVTSRGTEISAETTAAILNVTTRLP